MQKFDMTLPVGVEFIIDTLWANGFSAHVVGGAVRDSLLGRELGDFDITTDASPEQTKRIFSEFKTVDTGIKHGTVTVVIDHIPYEVTTYRIDGDYKDKRHPDSVTFTSELAEDLKRRDFTVNAMCYNSRDGLTDLFGGTDDAKAGMIRAVGDPYVRFSEDALRILRALRFAAVLDFDIEERTAEAAYELRESLKEVSGERIYAELKKLISGMAASRVIREYAPVLSVVMGGITVDSYPADSELYGFDLLTRLAAVFLLNSDAPVTDALRVLSALRTDNLTRSYTEKVLSAYDNVTFESRKDTVYALFRHGEQVVSGVLKLGILVGRFTQKERNLFAEVIADAPAYRIADLKIGGRELLAMGYKGADVGAALERLLVAVIEGDCENIPESLIGFLKSSK